MSSLNARCRHECHFCDRIAVQRCDGPGRITKVCRRLVCRFHAVRVGDDIDLCVECHHASGRAAVGG